MLDHRDLGAGGVEDVGKLTADRAATDDNQTLVGLLRIRRAEERFRRQIARFFQARQGGDIGPAASSNENLIARQSDAAAVIQGDGDGVVVDERRRAVKGVDIGELVVITLNSRTFIDLFPQSLGQDIPIQADVVGKDADTAPFADFADAVGCRDHDLRRDTAAVQTSPAEPAAFNDSHLQALGQGRIGHNIGCPRTDDNDIIFLHK